MFVEGLSLAFLFSLLGPGAVSIAETTAPDEVAALADTTDETGVEEGDEQSPFEVTTEPVFGSDKRRLVVRDRASDQPIAWSDFYAAAGRFDLANDFRFRQFVHGTAWVTLGVGLAVSLVGLALSTASLATLANPSWNHLHPTTSDVSGLWLMGTMLTVLPSSLTAGLVLAFYDAQPVSDDEIRALAAGRATAGQSTSTNAE